MTLRGIRVWKVKVSFPSFFLLDFLLSSTSRLERPEGFNANNLGRFSFDRLDGQDIKFGSDGTSMTNILRRWDVTKEKQLLFPRPWRSNRCEFSWQWIYKCCIWLGTLQGAGNMRNPYYGSSILTRLLKGEPTIHSIKSSPSGRDGTTLGLRGQCVLILTILFYKITFCFSLTISLILLRVMLYSQTFL